jgi:fructose-bisphosphate aldolase class II
METLQAIIEAATESNVPIILQVTESTIDYMGLEYLTALVQAAIGKGDHVVALHLDHGTNFEMCRKCIQAGFSSVMIDKSSLDIQNNIYQTKELVSFANKYDSEIAIEGEIGTLRGIEDDISVASLDALFTNPEEAAYFVDSTGVDSLAVAIGTSHGPHKGKSSHPKLDINRLADIKNKIGNSFPLVLHGASAVYSELTEQANRYGADIRNAIGISDVDIEEAIKAGINKINVDTDIRMAFVAGLRQSLALEPDSLNIRKHFGEAKKLAKQTVLRKIELISGTRS